MNGEPLRWQETFRNVGQFATGPRQLCGAVENLNLSSALGLFLERFQCSLQDVSI